MAPKFGVVLNAGEIPRPEVEGIRAVDLEYLSLPAPKPVKCYNCKSRGNKFLNLDNSLIAEAVSSFCALLVSSVVVGFGPSSKLVVSEEEDGGFWDGEDIYFPYPLGDSHPDTFLDWALLGRYIRGD